MAEVSVFVVYGLVDPRDGAIFYIGCTISPRKRLANHCNDPASAAYRRAQELRKLGLRPEVREIATYEDKRLALAHETKLIRSLPDLLNLGDGDYRCPQGCLCAKHDPTPYLGNPNWADEYDAKRRKRAEDKL